MKILKTLLLSIGPGYLILWFKRFDFISCLTIVLTFNAEIEAERHFLEFCYLVVNYYYLQKYS